MESTWKPVDLAKEKEKENSQQTQNTTFKLFDEFSLEQELFFEWDPNNEPFLDGNLTTNDAISNKLRESLTAYWATRDKNRNDEKKRKHFLIEEKNYQETDTIVTNNSDYVPEQQLTNKRQKTSPNTLVRVSEDGYFEHDNPDPAIGTVKQERFFQVLRSLNSKIFMLSNKFFISCLHCKAQLLTGKAYVEHFRNVHPNKQDRCFIPNCSFIEKQQEKRSYNAQRISLYRHINHEHSKKDLVDYINKQITHLPTYHTTAYNQKWFRCCFKKCFFQSPYFCKILSHFTRQHECKLIKCLKCKLYFYTFEEYQRHNNVNHCNEVGCLMANCNQHLLPRNQAMTDNMIKQHTIKEWSIYINTFLPQQNQCTQSTDDSISSTDLAINALTSSNGSEKFCKT